MWEYGVLLFVCNMCSLGRVTSVKRCVVQRVKWWIMWCWYDCCVSQWQQHVIKFSSTPTSDKYIKYDWQQTSDHWLLSAHRSVAVTLSLALSHSCAQPASCLTCTQLYTLCYRVYDWYVAVSSLVSLRVNVSCSELGLAFSLLYSYSNSDVDVTPRWLAGTSAGWSRGETLLNGDVTLLVLTVDLHVLSIWACDCSAYILT